MNESQKHFSALWGHVTGICGRKPSPLMVAIRNAIMYAFVGNTQRVGQVDVRRLYRFSNNIVNRNGAATPTVPGVSPLLWVAKGKWTVTNADLEFWADMSLFGGRDYFPEHWDTIASEISRALRDKRRYQSWVRYNRNGRIRKEHRRLLAALGWEVAYLRGDSVSLFVQGRRPTGNSGRPDEFARAMGWRDTWSSKNRCIPAHMAEKAWEVFDELPFALADVFRRDKLSAQKPKSAVKGRAGAKKR